MTHYALKMTDGSVAIMQTVGDATLEACLAKWLPSERAKVVSHQRIDPGVLPQDRTFRNAWVLAGAVIAHDMQKAREIQRERLRAARAPQLAALDTDYLRAVEAADAPAQAAVVAQKQALRDAPAAPEIDAAQTVVELKAITLDSIAEGTSADAAESAGKTSASVLLG